MSRPVNVFVELGPNDDIDKAIKKFSRKVRKCGILQEVRDRRYFVKRSQKKHDQITKVLFYRNKEKKEGNSKKKKR